MTHRSIVAVHGVGLDCTMWEPLRSELADYHMHTYDMIGHGSATKPEGPYSLRMFVEQLHAEIQNLGGQAVDVVGFSMGALVAQSFAATYPSLVRRLVLLNTVYDRTQTERAAIVARVADVRAGGFLASIDTALDRWFTPTFASSQEHVIAKVRTVLEQNDVAAYACAYEVFATADADLVSSAALLSMPTLVITGEADPRSTPAMSAALAATAPNAQVVVLPGLRHLAVLEDPAAVAVPLRTFLESA